MAAKPFSAVGLQKSIQSALVRTVSAALPKSSTVQKMDDDTFLSKISDLKLSSPPPPSSLSIDVKSNGGNSKTGDEVGYISGSSVKAAAVSTAPAPNPDRSSDEIAADTARIREIITQYSLKAGKWVGSSISKGDGLVMYKRSTSIGRITVNMSNPATTQAPQIFFGNVAQGDQLYQRIGQSVKMHHIDMRWRIRQDEVTNATNQTTVTYALPLFRIIIFADRMPLIGPPTLMDTNATPTDFTSILAEYALSQANDTLSTAPFSTNTHGYRYHILHDSTHQYKSDATVMPMGFATTTGSILRSGTEHGRINIDVGNMLQTYTDTTAGACALNQLYVYVLQDNQNNVAFQNPTFVYSTVSKFTDVLEQ